MVSYRLILNSVRPSRAPGVKYYPRGRFFFQILFHQLTKLPTISLCSAFALRFRIRAPLSMKEKQLFVITFPSFRETHRHSISLSYCLYPTGRFRQLLHKLVERGAPLCILTLRFQGPILFKQTACKMEISIYDSTVGYT